MTTQEMNAQDILNEMLKDGSISDKTIKELKGEAGNKFKEVKETLSQFDKEDLKFITASTIGQGLLFATGAGLVAVATAKTLPIIGGAYLTAGAISTVASIGALGAAFGGGYASYQVYKSKY